MMRFARFLFSGVGTILTALAFLGVIYLPGPLGRLEGNVSPVITDVTFKVETVDYNSSDVSGTFRIVRPECRFHHIEWVVKAEAGYGRNLVVDVDFLQDVQVHEKGLNNFGPWRISIDRQALEGRSVAAVFHQCPYRPWLTVTHFYP